MYASSPPQILGQISRPEWAQFDGQGIYKYAKFQRVFEQSTEAVRQILQTCPNKNERKRTLVDVKLTWLKKGENPCMPFWHTDCTMNMDHPTRPEKHYIYISGAGSRTRFLFEPLEVTPDFADNITPNMAQEIPEETWVNYGRQHPHICSRAEFSGYRLLIRVTESDLIPYSNKSKGMFHLKEFQQEN